VSWLFYISQRQIVEIQVLTRIHQSLVTPQKKPCRDAGLFWYLYSTKPGSVKPGVKPERAMLTKTVSNTPYNTLTNRKM
ncbi:MAG: hypothetical protein IJE43_25035, partial [Alphaproteobacteria bacterium]|nr:hypothetical protein [Alphaproteobacteria bacterium]